jgi:signal transduction histidine kinase
MTLFTLRPPKRWRSIDRTLPLLASGLVVLTVAVLAWTAHFLLERALVEASERRLLGSARAAAGMIGRPGVQGLRAADSATRAADEIMSDHLLGRAPREAAVEAIARPFAPNDTSKVYAALLDTMGVPVIEFRKSGFEQPSWPRRAVTAGEANGDSVSLGPFERLGGYAAYSTVRPLRAKDGQWLGYLAESRAMFGRNLSAFRNIIGSGVGLYVGDPGDGVWTDLEQVVDLPAGTVAGDSISATSERVAAWAPVQGTNWVVLVTQPTRNVLAPVRTLLWSVVPIGLLIALAGAALMWRMARRITHPIVELTDVAESVARDTNAMPRTDEMPTEIGGADEVTRLRYAFERMAERIAEREQLEEQLRQAQKMEAVGRLAGGVAHDFNNLLTAIRSYADLMLDDMPAWDPKRNDVQEIRGAAQRAAALTAQLLAFSRRTLLQPRVLDTAAVLADINGMLRRLMIEDIRLDVRVGDGVWSVKADRGQLEQVIVNLAVNARDAMPSGGTLRISASNTTVARPTDTQVGTMPPGDYVTIAVADTGVGMDETTRSRAFEPFFTTKPVGQGTGLGLATVHGIVAQSGGFIVLASTPGEGTRVTVYLPRAMEQPVPAPRTSGPSHKGHNETILLVEDESSVRALARRVLVRAGFRVLESTTPSDALRLAHDHSAEIRLVLTDVVMPEMSGPALATKITEMIPSSRVLFISGYTDDEVIGRGLANPGMLLLQKPFSAQQLVERVRLALDAV